MRECALSAPRVQSCGSDGWPRHHKHYVTRLVWEVLIESRDPAEYPMEMRSSLAVSLRPRRMSRLTSAGILVLLVAASCGDATVAPTNVTSTTLTATTTSTQASSTTSSTLAPIDCEGVSEGDTSSDSEAVAPSDAAQMSITQTLRTDSRFDRLRILTEETRSPGLDQSWSEIWDWAANRMGDDREGVTVFAPIDAAFEHLEPELLAALEEGKLENDLRYSLIGHHYVHRLYPSSEFEPGQQRTWRGGGTVELTLEPLAWGGCPIVQTDIKVANGYIHAVNGIVVPAEVRTAATD